MGLKLSSKNPYQIEADYWCIGEFLWRKEGYKMVMLHLYASEEAAKNGAQPLDKVKIDISDAECDLDAVIEAAYKCVTKPKITLEPVVRRDDKGNPVLHEGEAVVDMKEKQVNRFADAKTVD